MKRGLGMQTKSLQVEKAKEADRLGWHAVCLSAHSEIKSRTLSHN